MWKLTEISSDVRISFKIYRGAVSVGNGKQHVIANNALKLIDQESLTKFLC